MFPKMRYPRSEKLINEIIEIHPWILDDCIEVFVPETWNDIVLYSIERIKKHFNDEDRIFDNNSFEIKQIKEKFGRLRIYYEAFHKPLKWKYFSGYNELSDHMDDVLYEAERESSIICSVCGIENISFSDPENPYALNVCEKCNGKTATW